MILRPYQERAITDLRAQYQAGKKAVCLVLPTGAGKTVVASEVIRSAIGRGRKVLFLAHRQELVAQSVAKLAAVGVPDVRVIQAAQTTGPSDARVTVASIQTLARRADRPPADLVIFDEAHHVAAETWRELAANYQRGHLLGLTATPERGDGAALGDVFDGLVVGATMKDLTEAGHLVQCKAWAPIADLKSGQLAKNPIDAYTQITPGKRAVVFCKTVEEAKGWAADYDAAGHRAAVVHDGMSAQARKDTLAAFAAGDLRVVANVYVLTEGWDDPGCEVCVLARNPKHESLYIQMVGRVLRPAPGKEYATILDLAGCIQRHGLPIAERVYSLDGKAISIKRGAERQCQYCGCFIVPTDGHCPECGTQFTVSELQKFAEQEVVDCDLEEVTHRLTPVEVLQGNIWWALTAAGVSPTPSNVNNAVALLESKKR
jgi:DNA repair protein RadD